MPCRPSPKPNNRYLYLIGHPAHQRSYDLLLHHGFYCSPILHLSGKEPSFSSKSVLLYPYAMTSALLHSSPQHYYITLSLHDIICTTLIYFLLLRDDSQVFTIIPTCLFHHYLSQGDPSRCFNLLPIITRLCLALPMRWSITLTTSDTPHKYLPLRIVAMASRIAPHYSL